MKKTISLTAALLLCALTYAQPEGRQNFNKGWFFVHDTDREAMIKKFDEGRGETVDLPHDWGVEGDFRQEYPGETGKLQWWGYARYGKEFRIPDGPPGKKTWFLEIDGAMARPKVYCNGKQAGEWAYGYSSFRTDLTPFLHEGTNSVYIEIDNRNGSSRWYPGGGIYRNVWLTEAASVGIAHWGTFVTAELNDGKAVLKIRTTLRGTAAEGKLTTTILDKRSQDGKGKSRALATVSQNTGEITDGKTVEQTIELPSPELWDIDSPNMYTAVSELETEGQRDVLYTAFGIRDAKWTAEGFFLNGSRLELNGVCLHHDAGALGAAWNSGAWERRLLMLKQMGCNAIRTSHNPPAPEFLDLCDRLGFVVLDEFTDSWTIAKTPEGYSTMFDEWAEKDLTALVRRDRNHPCVIAWSIGNEVREQGDPSKFHIARELGDIVRREDPTRPTTAGCDILSAAGTEWRNTIDLYGFNYKPRAYAEFRKDNPGKPYYGSETASTISSRGFYVFPVSDDKSQGKQDFQMSSYDLYAPAWATTPDTEFEGQDRNPWVAGEFVWTGFDYLGEPTPYNRDMTALSNFHDAASKARAAEELRELGKISAPSRSSYFGIIDLAGFPKDRYWTYRSRWRPDIPSAHILPHWNWKGREGEITPVMVYTSGDSAELFVNGKSMGRKTKGAYEYRLRWNDVTYEPGTVKVIAYKNGVKWAEDEVRTSGEAAKVEMAIESGSGPGRRFGGDGLTGDLGDRTSVKTEDLTDGEGNPRYFFIDVKITDKEGITVPDARNLLTFGIEGPGEIVAADAGDATSHVPFRSHELPAFNGLCSVIVKADGNKGRIKLRAESDGLRPAEVVITVR